MNSLQLAGKKTCNLKVIERVLVCVEKCEFRLQLRRFFAHRLLNLSRLVSVVCGLLNMLSCHFGAQAQRNLSVMIT